MRRTIVRKGTTLFLKGALFAIGILVLSLCIFIIPKIGTLAAELYPDMRYLQGLIVLDLFATALPFYVALYQALQLLNYIDASKAFSDLSVRALKKIKYCALIISILYVFGLPMFYLLAERDDAPGLIVIGLVMIFAALVIAVFAAVLETLLAEAIEMKSEYDLTV
jgi:Protein of unknown function (DUF2975)